MFEYSCNIVRVVDGDTVDVDIDLGFGVWIKNQRIRLYGIDTPESRTRDLREKFYGKYAASYLSERIGDKCVLRTKKDKAGKYGRILGEFIAYDPKTDSTRSINEMMIQDSVAVAYHGQSKESIAEAHLANYLILEERGISYTK
jgi:micrococcal nuclease